MLPPFDRPTGRSIPWFSADGASTVSAPQALLLGRLKSTAYRGPVSSDPPVAFLRPLAGRLAPSGRISAAYARREADADPARGRGTWVILGCGRLAPPDPVRGQPADRRARARGRRPADRPQPRQPAADRPRRGARLPRRRRARPPRRGRA